MTELVRLERGGTASFRLHFPDGKTARWPVVGPLARDIAMTRALADSASFARASRKPDRSPGSRASS